MKKICLLLACLLFTSGCRYFPVENIHNKENTSNIDSSNEENSTQVLDDIYFYTEPIKLDTTKKTNNYIFEIDNHIIIYYVDGPIHIFDASTGKIVNEIIVPSQNENFDGKIIKTFEKVGYNFALLFKDKIIYCDSNCENDPIEEPLPEIIKNDIALEKDINNYDFNEKVFVWEAPDGIMIMDYNSGESRILLENSLISGEIHYATQLAFEQYNVISDNKDLQFNEPKLVCDGKKLAIQVISHDYSYNALAVYNILYDWIECSYSYPEQYNILYSEDTNYAIISEKNKKIINLNSMDVYDYFQLDNEIIYSYDYETFIIANYDPFEKTDMSLFIANKENITDKSKKLLSVSNKDYKSHIVTVTENFAFVKIISDNNFSLYAIKHSD